MAWYLHSMEFRISLIPLFLYLEIFYLNRRLCNQCPWLNADLAILFYDYVRRNFLLRIILLNCTNLGLISKISIFNFYFSFSTYALVLFTKTGQLQQRKKIKIGTYVKKLRMYTWGSWEREWTILRLLWKRSLNCQSSMSCVCHAIYSPCKDFYKFNKYSSDTASLKDGHAPT